MHKDEIQGLLDRFGFSVSLNKRLGETPRTHMMHVGSMFDCLVDYIVDEVENTTELVWAYAMEDLKCIETVHELEAWLNEMI
jgi:hypothetical protein